MRWTLTLLVGTLLACGSLPPVPGLRSANPSRITEEELRLELAEFSGEAERIIGVAAERIADLSRDRQIRRRTLTMRLSVLPLLREATLEPDPQHAYVSTLTITVMLHRYLESGEGSGLFAEHQDIAVEASAALRERLWEIGSHFLTAEELERIHTDVEEFARARPIRGEDRGFAIRTMGRAIAEAEQSRRFDWVLQVPMSPFRALEGVGATPAALREFNVTARQFVQVAESLPQQLRWQTELLLYDLEDRETVLEALRAADLLAESAHRLSAVAERLPADIRDWLEESQDTLQAVERTLVTAQTLAEPLERTAEHIRYASTAWANMLVAPQGAQRPAEQDAFDVGEWGAAARDIGRAAGELSALIGQLDTLLASPSRGEALANLDTALAGTDARARSLIDLAAWRGLQLIGAFFALLLASRWLAPRVRSRNG